MGKEVELRGRIIARRDFGKIVFLDLKDDEGKAQLMVSNDKNSKVYDLSSDLRIGNIIGVSGRTTMTKTGQKTIDVERLQVYTRCRSFLPDLRNGLNRKSCYNNRGLDILVDNSSFERFKKINRMLSTVRTFFYEEGYQEVDTGILQKTEDSAPARCFTTYCNDLKRDLVLRKSKEQRMKQLIAGGFEKIFEIGKSFRNEQITRKYHPEINGLELYCAYSNWDDMLALTNRVINSLNQRFGIPESNPQQYTEIKFYDLIKEEFKIDGRIASYKEIANLHPTKKKDYPQNDYGRDFMLMDMVSFILDRNTSQNFVLKGIPKRVSVLSAQDQEEPSLSQEFRYFVKGLSFAYGNTELTDSIEQERRLSEQANYEGKNMDLKKDLFLKIMKLGLPPLGGLGFGLERLWMLYTESHSAKDVIYYPL